MSDQPWSFTPAPVEENEEDEFEFPSFPPAPVEDVGFEPARPPDSARKAPAASFEVRRRITKSGKRRIFRYDVLENGEKRSEWSDLESAKEEAERIAAGSPVHVGRPTYESVGHVSPTL